VVLDDPDGVPVSRDTWSSRLAVALVVTIAPLAALDSYVEVLGTLPAFVAAWYVVRTP
jgi:hypothetical protein